MLDEVRESSDGAFGRSVIRRVDIPTRTATMTVALRKTSRGLMLAQACLGVGAVLGRCLCSASQRLPMNASTRTRGAAHREFAS